MMQKEKNVPLTQWLCEIEGHVARM